MLRSDKKKQTRSLITSRNQELRKNRDSIICVRNASYHFAPIEIRDRRGRIETSRDESHLVRFNRRKNDYSLLKIHERDYPFVCIDTNKNVRVFRVKRLEISDKVEWDLACDQKERREKNKKLPAKVCRSVIFRLTDQSPARFTDLWPTGDLRVDKFRQLSITIGQRQGRIYDVSGHTLLLSSSWSDLLGLYDVYVCMCVCGRAH